MAWSLLVVGLALSWLAIHLARRCAHRRASHASLPGAHSRSIRGSRWSASTHWQVSAHQLSIRVQTTAFNDLHDLVTAALAKPHNLRWRSLLSRFYDVGSVLGVVGLVGALCILIWTTARLASALMPGSHHTQPIVGAVLAKRSIGSPGKATEDRTYSDLPLHFIIPGFTVPLTHLPLLLCALVISQVLHEAGHALAAVLDSIPLLSAGASLILILPSAFVALPAAEISALPSLPRLRIVAAGAFHNLLLWALLIAGTRAFTALDILSVFGYTDVTSWARVVTSVAQNSPLHAHIPPGAVIVQLDDALFSHAGPAVDLWGSYLSEPIAVVPHADLGWCVEREWISDQPRHCCAATNDTVPTLACFTADAPIAERCVDPLLFMGDAAASLTRCRTTADCGSAHACLWQRSDQELLRVTLQLPTWLREGREPGERVVLWNGPRAEVFEVEVSTRLPRSRFLPLRLPLVFGTFFAYLSTLSLSLYFFNLAPLPYLDGAQFLDAAFDFGFSLAHRGAEPDLVALERGQLSSVIRDMRQGKQRFQNAIHILTATLIGMCIILGIANWLYSPRSRA
ncbi:hypothetical protein B0H21DRAFT_750382 [Amylocystis lapponica]|nr:hypothetical protein B0H21DRAFT_750382 [Amylocystis lapponica]